MRASWAGSTGTPGRRCATASTAGATPGPCAPASAVTRTPIWPHWSSGHASQFCRPRKKLARPPDRLGSPPPRLGGGLCRRGLVEPLGPADDARLGRDAAAQSQSTGEGRSAAQSSGGLRAVANRPGSSAVGETLRLKVKARAKDDPQPKALAGSGLLRTDQDRVLRARRCGSKSKHGRRTIRSPKLWRAQGCCEPTRIECCCALSKAARSAASHGLLRTDQDRVLLRFVEGRPVSRVTRAVANRPGSSAAALC